jgi:hypothetical protein
MQRAVEQGGGQRLIVSKGAGPLRERQVAGEHNGAALVMIGDR